jgi:hypothetical protein
VGRVTVGKNSKQLNLTISKRVWDYLEFLGDRGSTWGHSPTTIGHNILMAELNKLIDAEPDPLIWRAPK